MKNANYEKTFEALTFDYHSKEELHKMIVDMKKVSAEFYNKAIHIGNLLL